MAESTLNALLTWGNENRLVAGALVLVAALAFWYNSLVSAMTGNLGKRVTNPERGRPGDHIRLHAMYIPVPGCGGTASPFTTKVETYLRMLGLEYHLKSSDLKTSPNGRIPFMWHGLDQISDSRFIVKFLHATYGNKMAVQEPQDPVGQAHSLLIQRLCEQHMYFTNLYHSAATAQGRARAPGMFRAVVSFPFNHIFARAWWTGRTEQLRYQGMLTNSHDDISKLIEQDFTALASLLGDKTYFLGHSPCAADACVFGFLEAHTHGTGNANQPVSIAVRRFPNLMRFVDNIQKQYFADRLQKGFKLD